MLKRPAAAQSVVLKRPAANKEVVLKRPAAKVDDTTHNELCRIPLEWEGESDPKAQVQIFLVTAAKLVNDRDASTDDDLPPLQ